VRRRRTAELVSRESWRIAGEVEGHSPSETIRYLSDSADALDREQERERRGDGYVISPPRARRWWFR
jgi:hypothetical protein